MDVSRTKIRLDSSISPTSISGRREYKHSGSNKWRGIKLLWKNRVLKTKVSLHSKLQVFSSGWLEAICHLGQQFQLVNSIRVEVQIATPLHNTKAARAMRSFSFRSGAVSRSVSASHCTISEATTQQRTWMAESGGHCSITVRICSLWSSSLSCDHCIFYIFSPAEMHIQGIN